MQQGLCANFSVATDYYHYEYTSYENLSNLHMTVQQIEPVITIAIQFHCHQFATYYLCNYIFPPCDLTTGAPQAICTESCDYLLTECYDVYLQLVLFLDAYEFILNVTCGNTLNLQQDYGFPCSSSSLQNNCTDLLGILTLHFWMHYFLIASYILTGT